MLVPWLLPMVAASGLRVTASSPAVDCPSPVDVTEAIGRRLPASPAGEADWSIIYGWEGSPPSRTVTFRLLGPDGTPVLERRFSLIGHECVAAAAIIAAIVERYFRDVGWAAPEPLPPVRVATRGPAPPPPAPALPAPSPRAIAGVQETLRLSAGAAVLAAENTRAAATVGGRVRLVGPLHLGLSIFAPPPGGTEMLALEGHAQTRDWQARVFTWAVFPGLRVEWGAGLDTLVGLQTTSSSGISNPANKSRALFALGVGGGPCYHWGPRWLIGLELAVYRTLPTTTLYVTENGSDRDVLAPSAWRFLGALSVGYVLLN